MALRPAGIHPVEHLAPVLGFGAAGACLEGDQGIVAVVLTGEERFKTRLLHLLLQVFIAGLQLVEHRLVIFLNGHLADGHHVVPLGDHMGIALHLSLQLARALHHLLGGFLVVPEAGGLDLRLEPLMLLPASVQIQRIRQLVQLGTDIMELCLIIVKFNHTHKSIPRLIHS